MKFERYTFSVDDLGRYFFRSDIYKIRSNKKNNNSFNCLICKSNVSMEIFSNSRCSNCCINYHWTGSNLKSSQNIFILHSDTHFKNSKKLLVWGCLRVIS